MLLLTWKNHAHNKRLAYRIFLTEKEVELCELFTTNRIRQGSLLYQYMQGYVHNLQAQSDITSFRYLLFRYLAIENFKEHAKAVLDLERSALNTVPIQTRKNCEKWLRSLKSGHFGFIRSISPAFNILVLVAKLLLHMHLKWKGLRSLFDETRFDLIANNQEYAGATSQ